MDAIQHFEELMAELEDIIKQMESSALRLEESLKLYRRGCELVSVLRQALASAQEEVLILSREKEILEPFSRANDASS